MRARLPPSRHTGAPCRNGASIKLMILGPVQKQGSGEWFVLERAKKLPEPRTSWLGAFYCSSLLRSQMTTLFLDKPSERTWRFLLALLETWPDDAPLQWIYLSGNPLGVQATQQLQHHPRLATMEVYFM